MKITSPNNILSKYMKNIEDLISPHIFKKNPEEIHISVGVNINGVPHLGTYLVICFAFKYASLVRKKFSKKVKICIGINDNISYDSKIDANSIIYHKTYFHALGEDRISNLIKVNYENYLNDLSSEFNIEYSIEKYSDLQKTEKFRIAFINSLKNMNDVGWCLSPSNGILSLRTPCPKCGFSKRDGSEMISGLSEHEIKIATECFEHGVYEAVITTSNSTFIDLGTLYRNLIKEQSFLSDKNILNIIIKGSDWLHSIQNIDWAHGILGTNIFDIPVRLYSPQILSLTGAKLSKSLIEIGDESMVSVPKWLVDMNEFKLKFNNGYTQKIINLTELFTSEPKHVFRSYTHTEIIHLLDESVN